MNRIKILALALFLGLAGAVYAAGQNGQSVQKESCPMTSASCDHDASCCDDGCPCCKAHKADHEHSNANATKSDSKGNDCCHDVGSCCKSGAPCCSASKSRAKQDRRKLVRLNKPVRLKRTATPAV